MGVIAALADAFVKGDDNLIERIIEKKLEEMGEGALLQLIGGPLGTAARVAKAIETGGGSEFMRLRNQWLAQLRPVQPPVIGRVTGAYERAQRAILARGRTRWGRTDWAQSREDWLDNRWRHDWRSQPRVPAGTREGGRWLPGRLDYVPTYLQYRGTKAGRTVRTFRRKRREKRRQARLLAKRMIRAIEERSGD